jgi:translation initiation factor IF-2
MNAVQKIAGARPPVVAIVGHIDHGKSTLLDYVRRTNVVEGEAGGITQHLSAYEAIHKTAQGERTITFLDTPGHEAFRAMRSRGLEVADVAILVVSAEEGAKPQTLEALKLIGDVGIPYIVALTKIDKPAANLERAKSSLLENGVYLEGLGGEIPYVALSSKTGEGVPELLDLILLAADLEGLSADPTLPAEGVVIEAHVDSRRGNTATLIVENGSLRSGEHVVAGESIAPTRIMENFLGKSIKEALPGSPVRIVGFSTLPVAGTRFNTVKNKKEAEESSRTARLEREAARTPAPVAAEGEEEVQRTILPLVIKTDVAGTGEAVLHELGKLPVHSNLEVRVVYRGVGAVTEGDLQFAAGGKTPGIIVGFNVAMNRELREEATRLGIAAETFDIIYKLAEWLGATIEERRPRMRTEERTGSAKVLKFFSATKGAVVLGGRVEEGELRAGEEVRLMRRDLELGRGTVVSLQAGKTPVKKVEAGSEFGAQIKLDAEPAPGDRLEAFEIVFK